MAKRLEMPARRLLLMPGLWPCVGVIVLALSACVDQAAPRTRLAAVIVDVCSGIADGALCNDKNTCSTGDKCLGGICVGTPAADGTACTDENQCTSGDVCNQGACAGTPVAEGTACTDGDPCTGPDSCQLGLCKGGPGISCDDGISCTTDTCVTGVGCRFVMTSSCQDGDAGGVTDGPPPDDRAPVDGVGPGDGQPAGDGADAVGDASGDADDGSSPDITVPGDGVVTADGADATEDQGNDAQPDAADAPDATPDGRDAGTPDLGADAQASPVFEARGGACSCAMAVPPSPAMALSTMGLLALLLASRRRR